MRETGWLGSDDDKSEKEANGTGNGNGKSDEKCDKTTSSAVIVIPKRWQEALSDGDLARHGPFDGVFYDPFDDGEIDVFLRALPEILSKKEESVASFFNGLCSDNASFHRVACTVVARKLSSKGLDCSFVPLPLPASATSAGTWGGVTNRYWQLDSYNLPVISWRVEGEGEEGEGEEGMKG